jgi:hypothetical protein
MSYSEFTIEALKDRFGLSIREQNDLYARIAPVPVSPHLAETLRVNVPLALAISTEKARSEMIITPVLIEVWQQCQRQVSLFSGVDFNVSPEDGLKGTCDYLFSRSAEQLTVEAPIVTVVEAKNENLRQGTGQCLAEMVAAQMFNQKRGHPLPTLYGAVTTGSNWRFLQLAGSEVQVDLTEYYIKEVERIVGILVSMVKAA